MTRHPGACGGFTLQAATAIGTITLFEYISCKTTTSGYHSFLFMGLIFYKQDTIRKSCLVCSSLSSQTQAVAFHLHNEKSKTQLILDDGAIFLLSVFILHHKTTMFQTYVIYCSSVVMFAFHHCMGEGQIQKWLFIRMVDPVSFG